MARPVTASSYAERRRPMLRWVFLVLLIIPVVEIAAIIAVGRVIGGWPTLGLLVVESLLGAWLVRREGSRTWTGLQQALQTGRMPSRELADAALVLIGGTLLLTPGFVTDIAGFFFILPVTRPIARRFLEAAVRARLLGAGMAAVPGARRPTRGSRASDASRTTVEGEIVDR